MLRLCRATRPIHMVQLTDSHRQSTGRGDSREHSQKACEGHFTVLVIALQSEVSEEDRRDLMEVTER